MMSKEKVYNQIIIKGDQIFNMPEDIYKYNYIINGCIVKNKSGKAERMYAVGSNTWRGFHKKDKEGIGSKEVFTSYFTGNKTFIVNTLKNISSEEELHEFENKICKDIKEKLILCIKENMLNSYNKIRKPIDLYIEHIVSMADDFTEDERARLSDFLFLPLDSQMFTSEYIFTEVELYKFNLSRNSSFKDVYSESCYKSLQELLELKAQSISKDLDQNMKRIYFDLLWNERFLKEGKNLFETNL